MIELEDVLCHVMISTGYWMSDEQYIELNIEFKDGPLEGKTYKIDIRREDLEE
jgi:hypothetical protein